MKLEQLNDKIFTISDVLSGEACTQYITYAEALGFGEAMVNTSSGQQMHKSIRNNDRAMIVNHEISNEIWDIVEPIFPKIMPSLQPLGLNELIRFYRYDEKQRFKPHKDGRYKASDNIESRFSLLIYLNEQFEGGQTAFRDLAQNVQPKTGQALCFQHEVWHESLPIKSGRKYVLRSDVMFAINRN